MKNIVLVFALAFNCIIVKLATAVPQSSLIVNSKPDKDWFKTFKADFRDNPEKYNSIFQDYFNQKNLINGLNNTKVRSVIASSAVLDSYSNNLQDQQIGALFAKWGVFKNIDNLSSAGSSIRSLNINPEIEYSINEIDSDLAADYFAALSFIEEQKNFETRQLLQMLKLKFRNFSGNSEIETPVLNAFLASKTAEIKHLKQQTRKIGLIYRSALKLWISHTMSMLETIENFTIPINSDLFLRENSDIINYSIDDQEFIGEVIGQIIIAKISGNMEKGDIEAASKEVSNVLLDLTAYCSVLTGAIGLCYWLAATPIGPVACTLGITVASLSTLLLVIRTCRNIL